jgi:hypothetical protein
MSSVSSEERYFMAAARHAAPAASMEFELRKGGRGNGIKLTGMGDEMEWRGGDVA